MISVSTNLFGGLTDLALWIFLALCIFFVLFSTLATILIIKRKRSRNKAHVLLLGVCLLFLLFFIGSGLILAPTVRAAIGNAFLDKLAAEYQNLWLNVLHVAVLAPLLFCTAILLFPRGKKARTDFAHTRYKDYFSKFDEENDDIEIIEVGNAFADFGNSENDIKTYLDRTVKKISSLDAAADRKNIIAKLDFSLEETIKHTEKT